MKKNLSKELKDYIENVLKDYVKDAMKKGYSEEEIKKILKELGHDEEITDISIKLAKGIIKNLDELDEDSVEKAKAETEISEKIIDFVVKHIERGYSIKEIKEILFNMGHEKDYINKIIAEIERRGFFAENEKEEIKKKDEEADEDKETVVKVTASNTEPKQFQRWLFISYFALFAIMVLLSSTFAHISFAITTIAFLAIMLLPIADYFFDDNAFIISSILASILIPTILLFYNLNPSIMKISSFNILMFLLYIGIKREIEKKNKNNSKNKI